jgi:hypothetical protein
MRLSHVTSAVAIGFLLVRTVSATTLAGTVPTFPSGSVVPGLTAAPAGTLLASLSAPFTFTTVAGTTKGTAVSAVFLNSSGTLDFYYQVVNDPTSATAIARVTVVKFTGFITNTGFRLDGLGPFVPATRPPVTADRNAAGNTVGFSFNPPDGMKILPGTTSSVMVVSTNSTMFTTGNLNLINSGSATVAAFQPAGAVPPTISKAFGAASIAILGTTSLTFTIANPSSSTALTGVAFSDTLPVGLVVATPNGLTGSCGGGTIAATAGSSTISLTGAMLAASGSCMFSVDVTAGGTDGTVNNITTAVTSNESAPGNTASASIEIACGLHLVHGHISTVPPGHFPAAHVHHGQHGHSVTGCSPPHHGPFSFHATPEPEEQQGMLTSSGAMNQLVFVAAVNQDGNTGPARRGTVLQLFGSAQGLFIGDQHDRPAEGFVPPASGSPLYQTTTLPQVRIGGAPAKVMFSGLAPGLAGAWQINVVVPEEIGSGTLPVAINYEGDDLRSIEVKIE